MNALVRYCLGFAIALSVMGYCAGCSSPSQVILYNNSRFEIHTLLAGKQCVIAPGYSFQIPDVELEFGITVQMDGVEYNYSMPGMSIRNWEKFAEHKSFLDITRLQLNADNRIYVVQPKQKFPVTSFSNQPDGFPIKADPAK